MCASPARSVGRPPAVRVDSVLLRAYRERAGLSREDLAALVRVTTRTLQRAETEGIIGMPLLKLVCEALRVPVVAVLLPDVQAIRDNLRAYGFAPGLPPTLLGRASELATLKARVVPDSITVLEGPVGVGKTSLVQQLAQDLADAFPDGVVWVRADFGEPRLVKLDIARALGFDTQLPGLGPDATGRDWRQAFASHFWRGRRLLVLDDVIDAAAVRAFSAEGIPATIVVTTRFRHVAEALTPTRVSVSPLSDAVVLELLGNGLDRAQLERDPASLARLLEVIGGLPGVAHVVHSALRRERLTTPASWLTRFHHAQAARGDRFSDHVLGYYDSLERQLSRSAWDLFAALGVFASEPVPLSWAAAAAHMPLGVAQSAASELLDAQVVNLHQGPRDDDPEPWLRLATHPAAAARALLGERIEVARRSVIEHAIVRLGASRAQSPTAFVRYYQRHQALFMMLRRVLEQGIAIPFSLAAITSPDEVAPQPIDGERARLLVDLITAVAPLLFDHTIADDGHCFSLGLVAARSIDDPRRQGLVYNACSWWRVINVSFTPHMGFHAAALAALQRAGDARAILGLQAAPGAMRIATGTPTERADQLARLMAALEADREPSVERACLRMHVARDVMMASTQGDPLREAAMQCQLGLDELALLPAASVHLAALLRFDRETYRRCAGDMNQAQLGEAVTALREQQRAPWLKAALLAHAACLGATDGFASIADALQNARRELREVTRDCPREDAPRLLWFVATCALYELTRRALGDDAVVIRFGLGGHGVPAYGDIPAIATTCGTESLIMLSTQATAAFLELDYIDLALTLAEHVTDGRLVSPALRQLRELLVRG